MNDECACIYVDADDVTTTIQRKMVEARKEHVCCECQRYIEKGDVYESYKGIDDGMFFASKTCPDCLSIRDEFFCSGWIWGRVLELLGEHVMDMNGAISADCLLRLTPGARDVVFDLIERAWAGLERDEL